MQSQSSSTAAGRRARERLNRFGLLCGTLEQTQPHPEDVMSEPAPEQPVAKVRPAYVDRRIELFEEFAVLARKKIEVRA